jgi:hypothetical protein
MHLFCFLMFIIIIARFNFPESVAKKRISFLFQKSDMLSLGNPSIPGTWERRNWLCFTTSFTMTPGCTVTVTSGLQGWLCGTLKVQQRPAQ